jgi:CRP/FNR family transcriptional regulator, dissimilatory nitrate respiration regulator
MDKILEIISGTPLFNGLNENQLKAVRRIAVDRFVGKGKTVFLEGDRADGFFIVADGRVKIFKVSMEGKEQIFHIYGPGSPFGEVPVFSGGRFPANAETLLKSHLLFIPRSEFVKMISDDPSLSLNMLAVLSQRLRQFTVQIGNLSLKEVPGRLSSYLIYLSREQGGVDAIELTISKGQLASLLGTIPETLSRIFAKMSGDGLIEVEGRRIRLVDRAGLEDLAGHGSLAD